jgi:hypothetical protein
LPDWLDEVAEHCLRSAREIARRFTELSGAMSADQADGAPAGEPPALARHPDGATIVAHALEQTGKIIRAFEDFLAASRATPREAHRGDSRTVSGRHTSDRPQARCFDSSADPATGWPTWPSG